MFGNDHTTSLMKSWLKLRLRWSFSTMVRNVNRESSLKCSSTDVAQLMYPILGSMHHASQERYADPSCSFLFSHFDIIVKNGSRGQLLNQCPYKRCLMHKGLAHASNVPLHLKRANVWGLNGWIASPRPLKPMAILGSTYWFVKSCQSMSPTRICITVFVHLFCVQV